MKSMKTKVIELLKSIETGAKEPVDYINPNRFKQHNLMSGDGVGGFGTMLKSLAAYPEPARVETLRIFEDGDYVFTHSVYNLFGEKVGFDIFRFEDGLIVEHWDNLCEAVKRSNESGHSLTDGPQEAMNSIDTNENKELIVRFVSNILIKRDLTDYDQFFDGDHFITHHPCAEDGANKLKRWLLEDEIVIHYKTIHKVLGDGNFILTVSEGSLTDDEMVHPACYYDLFRIEDGKIAEHWPIMEVIPEEEEWKNPNGKFGFK